MGYRKEITNDFSWSKSRNTIFNTCKRDYFLRYYQSWEGWDLSAPPAKRSAYVLKKLENRYSWAGKVAHATLAEALELIRTGKPCDPTTLIEAARQTMRRDFIFSKARRYWREKSHRKEFTGLREHELDENVSPEEWADIWQNTKKGLEWWFSSKWPTFAQGLKKEQWLAADVQDFANASFMHGDVKVYAIPDFAYLDELGAVIVDWKTGKPRNSFDAGVSGYALFLEERFGILASTMRGRMVYLADGSEKEVEITDETLANFNVAFDESVKGMKSLLMGNGNMNRPISEEAFPMTTTEQTCERCVYQRTCGRAGGAKPRPDGDQVPTAATARDDVPL